MLTRAIFSSGSSMNRLWTVFGLQASGVSHGSTISSPPGTRWAAIRSIAEWRSSSVVM